MQTRYCALASPMIDRDGVPEHRPTSRFRRSYVAWLALGLVAFSLAASAQDEPGIPTTSTAASRSDAELPRSMFVSLKAVKEFFPEVSRQQNVAEPTASPGKPLATRMMVYASGNGAKEVFLAISHYETPNDSGLAYQETTRKTQLPEFNPIAVSNVGQQVFGGIITQGAQTQISLYTLDDTLIVTTTLAGYDASTENISKLVELTRKEVSEAHGHVPSRRRR